MKVWKAKDDAAKHFTRVGMGVFASAAMVFGLTLVAPSADATGTLTQAQLLMKLDTATTPQTVLLDASTGDILSVTNTPTTVANSVTVGQVCNSTVSCWKTAEIPLSDYSFAGVGTVTGTWTERGDFLNQSHRAQVCWTVSGSSACGPVTPAGTTQSWSVVVTGTKVDNVT